MKKIVLFAFASLLSFTAFSQTLKTGDSAPAFKAKSVQGADINIKGKKTFVTFLRYAGCPVCNFRIHELIKNYAKFQKQGIEIVAVFESKNETLSEYIKDTDVPFSVVGNEDLSLYTAYGVEKSLGKMMGTMFKKEPKENMKKGKELFGDKTYKADGSQTRIPADFLIAADGRIIAAKYGDFVGDHMPIKEILSFNTPPSNGITKKEPKMNTENQIKNTILNFEKAAAQRDCKSLEEILHHDYRVSANRFKGTAGTVIISREMYLQMMAAGKIGGASYIINFINISVTDHTAMAEVLWKSEDSADMHKYLFLVLNEKDKWQVIDDLPLIIN